MFALANKKQTIVAEALTRADKHFAGGDSISEFATIVGDYADFCDIRGQKAYVLGSCMARCCDIGNQDGSAFIFYYLGTKVEVVEIRCPYEDGEILNYQVLCNDDKVCEMKLYWVRKNPSGMPVGSYETPTFTFTGPAFGGNSGIADRIMTAIEKNRRCEFCGVLLNIYQTFQPIHMCTACAMTESSEPCKYCKIATGQIETGAHRECKRRRLM